MFVERHYCEIAMRNACINNLIYKHKKIYMAITDLDKAFDKVNRSGIIINLANIGINGRNLRLLIDELKNTKCEIVYNGLHSLQIIISDGTPQGHNESGPIFNIYLNPTLIKCLSIIKTYSYTENISAIYYADDGIKITLSLDELQKIIDIESKSLKNWNLESNASKSKIITIQNLNQYMIISLSMKMIF